MRQTSPIECFAICAPGLEPLLRDELAELSIKGEAVTGGVEWSGSMSTVALANLWSRIASRVVIRVGDFRARSFFELERHAKKIEWERYLLPKASVRFRVTCRKSKLYHSDAVAQRFQEAVARAVGDISIAEGGDEENEAPAQTFIVRFDRDQCTVSADTSGALLHRRGYRQAVAKAPLRETLAAAMLRGAGWNGRTPLVDPLCGSGTIPLEAALIARRVPSGIHRDFAFLHWPDAATKPWKELTERAQAQALRSTPTRIAGSDRDAGAIEAAKSNAERAGISDIDWKVQSISAAEPVGDGAGLLIANPPYGERIGEGDAIRDLYAQLGNVARAKFESWMVGILSPDARLDAQLKVKMETRFKTSNGGIPVHLAVGLAAK